MLGWKLTAAQKPSSHNSGENDRARLSTHSSILLFSCLPFGCFVQDAFCQIKQWRTAKPTEHTTLLAPGLGKARFCPLISTERVTRRQNFLAEKVWKQGLFFLPSWSPYGRLPTALHRMRAENCLRNKSSAFYCQTTNHLTHDLRPVFRVPRRPFHCQYVSLCTKGSEFCQRMLNQIYDCESVRIIWDLPGTCPNLKIRLLQWI